MRVIPLEHLSRIRGGGYQVRYRVKNRSKVHGDWIFSKPLRWRRALEIATLLKDGGELEVEVVETDRAIAVQRILDRRMGRA